MYHDKVGCSYMLVDARPLCHFLSATHYNSVVDIDGWLCNKVAGVVTTIEQVLSNKTIRRVVRMSYCYRIMV